MFGITRQITADFRNLNSEKEYNNYYIAFILASHFQHYQQFCPQAKPDISISQAAAPQNSKSVEAIKTKQYMTI